MKSLCIWMSKREKLRHFLLAVALVILIPLMERFLCSIKVKILRLIKISINLSFFLRLTMKSTTLNATRWEMKLCISFLTRKSSLKDSLRKVKSWLLIVFNYFMFMMNLLLHMILKLWRTLWYFKVKWF